MREGWGLTPLASVTRQVIEPIDLRPDVEYKNLGVKWYAAGTFLREPKPGRDIKASRLYRVRPGQFVYNRLFATEGSFALVRAEDAEAVASNEFPVFDVDTSRLLPEYLYLHFQQEAVWQEVNRQCTGTTKSRLRWKEERFRAYALPLPSLREQRRIVDLVGALDDTIAAGEREAAKTAGLAVEMRRALPTGDEVELGDLLTAIESGVSTRPVDGVGKRLKLLSLAAVRPARFHPTEIKEVGAAALPERARLREGDLLVTRSNTPDRVGYVCVAHGVPEDTFLPDLVWRLVPDGQRVSRDYLEQVLSSPQLRSMITASASGTSESMRKINKAGFARLRVPLPDRAQQDAYTGPLRGIADLELRQSEAIAGLKELRARLLPALLSGEHEIPESYDELMEVAS